MFLVLFAFLVEYNKIKNTFITFDCQTWAANQKLDDIAIEAQNGLNRLWDEAEENIGDFPEKFTKPLDAIEKAKRKN